MSLIHLGATTHAFDQAQRYISLDFVPFTGGLAVMGPKDNRVAPPGPYMLFMIDDQGVPSHGEIVNVANRSRPPIGVGAPNVDEIHPTDTHVDVRWWAEPPTTEVDIEYSIDNGASWKPVVSNTPNDGSHIWVIPDHLETDVRVRVRDSHDPNRVAVNSGPFSIFPGPTKSRS